MDDHHEHAHKADISRRRFIARSALGIAGIAIAPGALLNASEAWGLEVAALKPETMKTLVLIARDIYPHDRIADRYYAIAMKEYETKSASDPALKKQVEAFVARLDKSAGAGGYLGKGWEAERVALLQKASGDPMFEKIRSGLVVSLYNQKDVWPIFGYEGESFSKGGYINRGFDDIDWL
ncbi:MAG: twin-arginine translocation signal domain-containing protein [Hyphomicrobiales bacterium]|nr:twin-arginine translocation signal domain-containing protein [Hyphomicrobiales bacterium]